MRSAHLAQQRRAAGGGASRGGGIGFRISVQSRSLIATESERPTTWEQSHVSCANC